MYIAGWLADEHAITRRISDTQWLESWQMNGQKTWFGRDYRVKRCCYFLPFGLERLLPSCSRDTGYYTDAHA